MAVKSELCDTDMRRMEEIRRTLKLASLESIVFPVFQPDPNDCPVLQIHSVISAIDDAETGIQHRLFLADGYHFQRAVLARELNPMVENKQLDMKSGSIVRILKYSLLKSVDDEKKRLIKILDMEVQIPNFDPIGQPLDFLSLTPEISIDWDQQDWDERNVKWLDPEDGDPDNLDSEREMGG